MAFCKFSSEYIAKSYTMIDNVFFARYLPSTPPKLTAIYLYGLYLCALEGDTTQNSTVERFAQSLGYDVEDIVDAYNYWEEQGLVRVVSTDPLQVQYQPVRGASSVNRRYSKDKYLNFNLEIQKIISERQITPNEFEEYYALLEGFSLPDGRKMTPEALLLIVRFCTNIKGPSINYRYIITVAQNWAKEGFVTAEQVEQKLNDYNTQNKDMVQILKALGSSKKPNVEDYDFLLKWTTQMGFTLDVICFVAKSVKKSAGVSGFEKLDKKLQRYYEARIFSEEEITSFEKNKDAIFSLARDINRTLGLFYDDVTNQVETYISPWLALGFEPKTLLAIAQNCYLKSKRTLSALNSEINELYEQGIVSQNAYNGYLNNLDNVRKNLTQILKKLHIERNVTSLDMEFWNRWVTTWGFGTEVIDIAVDFASKKGSNLSYVNTMLADWHNQNIHSPAEAIEFVKKALASKQNSSPNDTKIKKRKYSEDEQKSVFDSFNEIEI